MHGLQNCTSLRFSPSTDHLIAMSQTGVCIADSISGKTLTREDGPLFASAQLQFSDNGHQPAFFNATEVRLFDLKTGMWIGQPLLSDNGILLASPLPKAGRSPDCGTIRCNSKAASPGCDDKS
jgi:hypothetical protein